MFFAPLPRTLDAALRDVTDAKVEVRASAARDLVPHGEAARDRVVGALTRALGDDAPAVREAAAEGLGDLRASEALAALLVAVEDDDQLVRQKAIGALGEIRDQRAQRRLERALTDPRPEVRSQAVMAFPRVSSSRADAVAALVRATRDEDEHVAHIAFRMAEEQAEEEGGRIDAEILGRARACLEHPVPRVRAVAAVLVAMTGDRSADAALLGIVSGRLSTDEPEDVAAAIDLVGELGLSAAIPHLERRAFKGVLALRRDPYFWHARAALARLGHARARRAILEDLGSSSFERRTLAVSAAGKARLVEARPGIEAMRGKPERASPDAVELALEQLAERPATGEP